MTRATPLRHQLIGLSLFGSSFLFLSPRHMYTFTATDVLRAYKLARKSRKKKEEVYLFDQNREERLIKILKDIEQRRYIHNSYKEIIIYDAKKRYIFSPCFRDHILHHLLYAKLYPILDAKMVHSSFACRVGYGNHKGIKYLQKIVKSETREAAKIGEELYYYKIDISKYFFSIHHERLKQKLKKYIADETFLYLIDTILESYTSGILYDELLKDSDFYTQTRDKGLPIGSILSQLFANFYLNDLDQFLKHTLKLRFVRYMDDIVILGTAQKLKKARREIQGFLVQEKLILHPRKQHFHPVSNGVTFVGYKIEKGDIFVGKRTKKSLLKFIDSYGSDFEDIPKNTQIRSCLASRLGVFIHSVNEGKNYLNHLGISL